MGLQNKIYWVVIDGILSDGIEKVRKDAEGFHTSAFAYDYAWHRVFVGFTIPAKALGFRKFVKGNYVYSSLGVGQSLYPFLLLEEKRTVAQKHYLVCEECGSYLGKMRNDLDGMILCDPCYEFQSERPDCE